MTDQEINEAVARKLGWTHLQWREGPSFASHWTGLRKDHSVEVMIPDYCHSIEAAWKIVEHLVKTKLVGLVMGAPGKWMFTIEGRKEMPISDTAPMAICQAFLKLP